LDRSRAGRIQNCRRSATAAFHHHAGPAQGPHRDQAKTATIETMSSLRITAGILLFTMVSPIIAAPTEKTISVLLRWRAVEFASGYVVEIRDAQGRRVLRQDVTERELRVTLPPALYEHRVATRNRFGVVAAWSEWGPLDLR